MKFAYIDLSSLGLVFFQSRKEKLAFSECRDDEVHRERRIVPNLQPGRFYCLEYVEC